MDEKTSRIRNIVIKFCEMMLEKELDVQYVKINIGMKNKSKISFKKFREYV